MISPYWNSSKGWTLWVKNGMFLKFIWKKYFWQYSACRRPSLSAQPSNRWATAAGDGTSWHYNQLRTGNLVWWVSISSADVRICHTWKHGSIQSHVSGPSRWCLWCNGAGGIFLAHFWVTITWLEYCSLVSPMSSSCEFKWCKLIRILKKKRKKEILIQQHVGVTIRHDLKAGHPFFATGAHAVRRRYE